MQPGDPRLRDNAFLLILVDLFWQKAATQHRWEEGLCDGQRRAMPRGGGAGGEAPCTCVPCSSLLCWPRRIKRCCASTSITDQVSYACRSQFCRAELAEQNCRYSARPSSPNPEQNLPDFCNADSLQNLLQDSAEPLQNPLLVLLGVKLHSTPYFMLPLFLCLASTGRGNM